MFKHTSKLSLLTALTLSLLGASACVVDSEGDDDVATGSDEAVTGQASVRMGGNGKLEYLKDSTGDTIPNFSYAGYHGGGVPLPNVRVVKEVAPVAGDNLRNIQDAIDAVAKMPLAQRGAIHLKKGTYRLSGTLRITASGIVLRGDGDGPDGTVLVSTSRDQITMIELEGGKVSYEGAIKVTDKYVPVGAQSVTLDSVAGLSKGDTIIVERPSTKEWIHEIWMDRIPAKDNNPPEIWKPGSHDIRAERVITSIDGKKVNFDAPLVNSLDEKFGGGLVRKVTKDLRISEVGVESMRGVSLENVKNTADMAHARDFITMVRVTNAWVQNVTGTRFSHSVVDVEKAGDASKWITVRRSKALEPIGVRTGGNFYAFATDGQMTLFYALESTDGRHDYVTGGTIAGLNVFLESSRKRVVAKGNEEIGPHGHWANGVLFDNMDIQGGNLSAHNEANAGGDHGWSAANVVIWNSKASDGFVFERPPTAHQWLFGSTGQVRVQDHDKMPEFPCNELVSMGKALLPKSLYRQQLAERKGADAAARALDD